MLNEAGLSIVGVAFFAVTNSKSTRRTSKVIRLLVLLAVVYLVLRWFEHRQVYQPSRPMDANGSELGRPFEDVHFQTADGLKLNGWFFPADKDSSRQHLVYLLCHGNAGNISHRLEHVAALLETGASVFIFDYRGYGRSEGRPSEEGTYLDGQAAHQWVRQRGFAAANIIVLGESLGGGIASELALREPSGGLILQSTYTSVTDLGAELFPWLPVRWLGIIKYDTHSKLPRIKVPVLVMHSRADGLIGFHHAEKNFAAANEPKLLWEIVGRHNDFLEAGRERYLDGLNKFLALLENSRTAPKREHHR
ncbi:MAG: alpha/beta hydrolase [Verrucomicrobia bacterium]|nr:MAG: alpha/beta hydrolase [Verrucomicrobiota bacterium]